MLGVLSAVVCVVVCAGCAECSGVCCVVMGVLSAVVCAVYVVLGVLSAVVCAV